MVVTTYSARVEIFRTDEASLEPLHICGNWAHANRSAADEILDELLIVHTRLFTGGVIGVPTPELAYGIGKKMSVRLRDSGQAESQQLSVNWLRLTSSFEFQIF